MGNTGPGGGSLENEIRRNRSHLGDARRLAPLLLNGRSMTKPGPPQSVPLCATLAFIGLLGACASGQAPEPRPEASGDGTGLSRQTEQDLQREGREFELGPQRLPKRIDSPFSANGHAQSWDGRLFIGSRELGAPHNGVGWVLHLFRPEAVRTDEASRPQFASLPAANRGEAAAWSPQRVLEVDGEGLGSHNAVALVPDPEFGVNDNPFPSTADCTPQEGGPFDCYRMVVITQDYSDGPRMMKRRLQIVVEHPQSRSAAIASAEFLDPEYVPLETTGGQPIIGIEPSVTADGRLLVFQDADRLRYSYNDQPLARSGWSEPRPFVDLHHIDHDTQVGGVRMDRRYPIAREPIRDAEGNVLPQGHEIRGAYPWISLSGESLLYTATRAEDGATRAGLSVISPYTGYAARHIDGPLNENRRGLRLFHSSPGGTRTLWPPYPEVRDSVLPWRAGRPVMPVFGSNTANYGEVSFEAYVDDDTILNLGMNELIDANGNVVPTKTPDTSGNFLTGILQGASFPLEHTGNDERLAGADGQAIYFPPDGKVVVPPRAPTGVEAPGLDALEGAVTVELFAKPMVDLDQDEENRYQYLIHRSGQFDLILEENRRVQASVVVQGGERRRSGAIGPQLPMDTWTHVAASYDGTTGRMHVYLDGELAGQKQFEPRPLASSDSNLVVGPAGAQPAEPLVSEDQALMMLDEVRVSSVARSPWEIAGSAYRKRETDLPTGLDPRELRDGLPDANPAAVTLGERLFFDPRLSGNGEIACASCHEPERGFTDGLALAEGMQRLDVNTPPVFNRAFSRHQMWDGEAESLEQQFVLPLEAPEEMDSSVGDAISFLQDNSNYVELFERAFGGDPSKETLGRALAAYQRSLLRGNAPVDRFEAGDDDALTPAEKRGRTIFHGRGRCVDCHSGSNFTDERFHDTGLTRDESQGRAAVTGHPADQGAFKTPSLRNLDVTGPFMHDGSIESLAEVVQRYADGGLDGQDPSPEIRPFDLSESDKQDLVAYLRALSDDMPAPEAPPLPEGRADSDGEGGRTEDSDRTDGSRDDPADDDSTDSDGDSLRDCNLDALSGDRSTSGAVRYAYCLVLLRSADDAGLRHYRGQLESGALDRATLVESLFLSDEAGVRTVSDEAFVEHAYERLLAREADPAGRRWALRQLEMESSDINPRLRLVRELIRSGEFCESHPPLRHAMCP
jgi:cytochrome c peroxidase